MNVLYWVEIDFSTNKGEDTHTTNGIVLADNSMDALRKFTGYSVKIGVKYIRMKVYPLMSEVHVCR